MSRGSERKNVLSGLQMKKTYEFIDEQNPQFQGTLTIQAPVDTRTGPEADPVSCQAGGGCVPDGVVPSPPVMQNGVPPPGNPNAPLPPGQGNEFFMY